MVSSKKKAGEAPAAQTPTQPMEAINPWYAKGMNLAQQEQYRDALYCFSFVLQSDPNNMAALTAKGECLMKMNRPEEALKAFMAAAGIDAGSPLAKEGKAAILRKVRSSNWT